MPASPPRPPRYRAAGSSLTFLIPRLPCRYGWGNDENCFPPELDRHKVIVGSLRYAPVLGGFSVTNVTVTGQGTLDGQGAVWWDNCTKCHYPPGNANATCLVASRPKLVEFLYADGVVVGGTTPDAPLTLQNSPFWTLTPS